jgi:hypothetical protein
VGQSFIYHQIRKMVGCIIKVILNNYSPSFVQNTFFRNQIHMPLAPASGLYLHSLSFEHYNKKTDIPEPLAFDLQDTPSIPALEQRIRDYILALDKEHWLEWVAKLRSSIYHGIEYIEEPEK